MFAKFYILSIFETTFFEKMKLNFLKLLLVVVFLLPFKSGAVFTFLNYEPDAICGEWWTPESDGKMFFYKSAGKYHAKVSWIKNPNDPETGKPRLDKKNPDPKLRNRPIMGLALFYDFVYDVKKQKYVDGNLYDSNSGNTYSCWFKMISNNVLELHGYIGFSLIGKSVFFTRVQ